LLLIVGAEITNSNIECNMKQSRKERRARKAESKRLKLELIKNQIPPIDCKDHSTDDKRDGIESGTASNPIHPRAINHPEKKNPKWKELIEPVRITVEIATLIWFLIYVGITKKQWDVAHGQWVDAQKNIVTDQRAWINIDQPRCISPPLAERRDRIGIAVRMTNTGKSPALSIGVDLSVGVSKFEIMNFAMLPVTNIDMIFSKHLDGEPCAPNGSHVIMINALPPIGMSNLELLRNRRLAYYFFIKIRYKDVFNYDRHTESCIVFSGPESEMDGGFMPNWGEGKMD
jgi:hypothetical protein